MNGPACTDGTSSGTDGFLPCWSCSGPLDQRAAFCHTCGIIQSARAIDHFAKLGLPVSFDVNIDVLDRHYFKLQRTFHPDRFASKSATEKRMSLQQTMSLNEAYDVLKDPISRAQYLLFLKGIEIAGQDGQTVSDPALLMEAMEMRESLAEADSTNDLDKIVSTVKGQIETCLQTLTQAFEVNDLKKAAAQALRLTYLSKLVDEARVRRNSVAPSA